MPLPGSNPARPTPASSWTRISDPPDEQGVVMIRRLTMNVAGLVTFQRRMIMSAAAPGPAGRKVLAAFAAAAALNHGLLGAPPAAPPGQPAATAPATAGDTAIRPFHINVPDEAL